MIKQNLGQRLSSLKVGQKIGLSYALALGIAVSGTIAGFGVGHHYQQHAGVLEEHSHKEVEILQRLQSRVLQARTHQQQLIPLAQYPEKFQDEYAHLLKHKTEIREIWAELKAFVAASWSLHQLPPGTTQRPSHPGTVPTFLQTYDQVPQRYVQEVERQVERIQKLNLGSPTDVKQAQALMLAFTNSALAIEFDGISDDLVSLIGDAYQELEEAERLQQQADEVAQRIVVTSIILSVAIAILLAILTSRAIARPIQALTSIAQRSTEESNFDLQATVEQDDEIGTLAKSFNQLTNSVKQLLQKQKTANEQLETLID
ncbi:MAG: HAMP domain-containing protein [Stenomitos frigidus ULC029]